MIIFEIPIIFFVVLVLGILGLNPGPILVGIGILGILIGAFFTICSDKDERTGSFAFWVVPHIVILLLGFGIGDQSLFELLF